MTAQKREQNLQDVPIVVNVINAQTLQDDAIRDTKDLQKLVPGLNVTSSSSEVLTTARIRGIGTLGDNPGLETSVGTVVDGVYRPRTGVGFGDIGELTRIEVLKGPQGTLFGKNTDAGLINIVTAPPSFKSGANAEFTVGNYGEVGGSAAVTGPLIADKLAGSLFFTQRKRDGFENVVTGQGPRTTTDDQTRNFYTFRGQLLYEPESDLTARLIVDYSRRSENCCTAVQSTNGPTTPLVLALQPTPDLSNPSNPSNRLTYANRPTTQAVQDGGASLELNWSPAFLQGAKLTSITAYRDWRFRFGLDADFTSADLLYRPDTGNRSGEEFKQFSQELRLGGSFGKLDYVVGGFYAHELLNYRESLLFGTDFPRYLNLLLSGGNPAIGRALAPITNLILPGTGEADDYDQVDQTYALFGNATYHLTDKLELTGGVRYTEDSKTLTASHLQTDGARACVGALSTRNAALISTVCQSFEDPAYINLNTRNSENEDAVTGTAKISYRFSPEYFAYFSYSRGYKAGGFNLTRVALPYAAPGTANAAQSLQPVTDTGFPGEFVNDYELGLKTTLFNRHLTLDGAVFNEEFSNFQLNAYNGLFFNVTPVPAVTSTGVDLDALWRPITGLTVQSGFTYANTRYRIEDASVLAASVTTSRLPGNRLNHAPLFQFTLSPTFEHPIYGDLVGHATVGLKYTSDYDTGSDLNPLKLQRQYALVDARIGIGPADRRWSVEVYVENLFDKTYTNTIFDAPFQPGSLDSFLAAPRTFGATLRARY